MPSRPVGDFVQFSIGGGWGSEEPQEGFAPVAVIRGTDIPRLKNGDFSSIPKRFESEKKLNSRLLLPGDIVLETAGGSARTGQFTGRSLLVTEELLATTGPAICASFCKRIQLDTGSVEPAFFQLFLEEMYSSGRVALYDSQSTGISNFQFKSFLKDELVDFPELPIQRAVSRVFGDIDAKRILNLGVSRKLEELASALFKSWFIDFDPVKAKMAGEAPVGMDAETAALFPDSMEDSELGQVPSGWQVSKLGELTTTFLGGTPSRKNPDFWGGNIPWINSGKVNDFRVISPSEFISTAGLNESSTKLLPKGTCVLAITGATLGQYTRLEIDTCANQSVVGVLESEAISNEFIYLLFASQIHRLIAAQTGGAQQHINKNDVNDFLFLCPPKEVMSCFTEIARPLFEAISVKLFQNQTLEALRDGLLPRLISGELEIPDEMLAA